MILGPPRSGTAWAANWLTTDTTLCLHEPLTRVVKEKLDDIQSSKCLGIACTALALWPDFVNRHPARKVILHRDPAEVRVSMSYLGIDGNFDFRCLDEIEGLHVNWRELFADPAPIYELLLQTPFNRERHEELARLNIQDQNVIRLLQGQIHALATA